MKKKKKKGQFKQVQPSKPNIVYATPEDKAAHIIAQSYEGPMPPPLWFSQYDQILPGAAERILATYEKQVEHRISIENKVIDSDVKNSGRGVTFGFILQLVAIGAGTIIMLKGSTVAGASIVATSFGTMIVNYVIQILRRGKPAPQKANN